MTPDLVVLGNLLVDDVVFPDGRTRMAEAGGAVLYASLGAHVWGARVGIASWRGDDYPSVVLDALAARGIDLAGVRDLHGPGLRTWLLYEGRRRRVVHRIEGPAHEAACPGADLPPAWSGARAFHLAPMPPAVQRGLADALGGEGGLLSLDPLIPLTGAGLAWFRELVPRVDVFLASEDEACVPDAEATLSGLATGRCRYVVSRRGARGGALLDVAGGEWTAWPARARRVVDPTGAGDAFAGGFLAGLLAGDTPSHAATRGVVSASFAIEDWSAHGLMAATPAHAQARLAEWFG
ncbi:MAG TPA: carbohydrate kinase family protein [Vicinamibacteria bacterium]